MQEVFNFLLDHLELIISVITLVISIVVFILKKRPMTDIFSQIYQAVIKYTIEVEKEVPRSEDASLVKFTRVMEKTTQFLRDIYPNIKAEHYMFIIGQIIEEVLSTPQKKEVK